MQTKERTHCHPRRSRRRAHSGGCNECSDAGWWRVAKRTSEGCGCDSATMIRRKHVIEQQQGILLIVSDGVYRTVVAMMVLSAVAVTAAIASSFLS